MAQQLVMKGFLKCDTCGAIFDSPDFDSPCCASRIDVKPSYKECATCTKYTPSIGRSANRLICPVCLSNNVRKISGWEVRIIKYFRK